jgi:hypothetical protein
MEEQWTPLPAEVWEGLLAVLQRPSPITPTQWSRLLEAFDAGASAQLACQYAGVQYETWLAERRRVPEFGAEADKVSASGPVAAMRFLQATAATEWRCALEFLKAARPDLFGSSAARTREVARSGEPGDDDPDPDFSAADIAAVLRLLGLDGFGGGEGDGGAEAGGAEPVHPNSPNGKAGGAAGGDGG